MTFAMRPGLRRNLPNEFTGSIATRMTVECSVLDSHIKYAKGSNDEDELPRAAESEGVRRKRPSREKKVVQRPEFPTRMLDVRPNDDEIPR